MSLQGAAPELVLASASASRRALLARAGLRFTVLAASIDEAAAKQAAQAAGARASEAALLLAGLKARRIASARPEALVIGSDQLLDCDGQWFDKPPDLAAARAQLLALRGRRHVLATAVVVQRGDRPLWQHVALPRLTMRAFDTDFLDAYLAIEGEVLTGTVGAYRLEGPGVHLFEAVEGEHAAILGLPLLPLLAWLRQYGVLR